MKPAFDRLVREAHDRLDELLDSASKAADSAVRESLRRLVMRARGIGKSLELSDPHTLLGLKMARANKRSRSRGWV